MQTYTRLHPPRPCALLSFLFNIHHNLIFYLFINLPYWELVVPPLYTIRFLSKQSRLWDPRTWKDTHPLLASEWELCHWSWSTWVTKPLTFPLIGLIKPEGESSCWQDATVYPLNHDILPNPTLPIPEVSLIHGGGRKGEEGRKPSLCHPLREGDCSCSFSKYLSITVYAPGNYVPRTQKNPASPLPKWSSQSWEQRGSDPFHSLIQPTEPRWARQMSRGCQECVGNKLFTFAVILSLLRIESAWKVVAMMILSHSDTFLNRGEMQYRKLNGSVGCPWSGETTRKVMAGCRQETWRCRWETNQEPLLKNSFLQLIPGLNLWVANDSSYCRALGHSGTVTGTWIHLIHLNLDYNKGCRY